MPFSKRAYPSRNKIYLYGSGSIIALLTFLAGLGYYGINITTTGDIQCAGTIQEPCISFINITTSKYAIVFPKSVIYFTDNPPLDYKLFKRDSRGYWRSFNISGKTMANESKWELKLIGYKKINETVKWGINTGGSDLDPKWLGYSEDDFLPELIYNKADITGGEASFKYCNPTSFDIDYSKDKMAFYFNKVKGDFNAFDIFVGTKVNITTENQVWIGNITTSEKISDNGTKYNESIDMGKFSYFNTTVEKTGFIPVEDTTKKLKPKECKTIKIIGTWKAGTAISIDWIAAFNISGTVFKQTKWAWWNISWTYVRPITITNSSILSDYQVNVLINSSYIPNLNWSNNGSDLRMFYNNGTANLTIPFWIKEWINLSTSNASIFVKTNSSTVYMSYGNPTATSASDDINTMVIPIPISTLTKQTAGRVTNTSKYNINITTLANNYANVYTNISSGNSLILDGVMNISIITSASWAGGFCYYWNVTDWVCIGVYNSKHGVHYSINNVEASNVSAAAPSVNTYYWYRMIINSTNLYGYYSTDGITYVSIADTTNNYGGSNPKSIIIGKGFSSSTTYTVPYLANDLGSGTSTTARYDNITVRKYMFPEPTYLIGTEQTNAVDSTPPVLTITSPTNNTNYTVASIDFNMTANEALNWSAVSLDGKNYTLTNSTGKWWKTNSTMTQGLHWSIFYGNDSSGNIGVSGNYTFRVNVTNSIMILYLNGTSSDRFYELGDAINITACSNITETVYINSNHPNIGGGLNGTSINGTTCATYLWNTSFVNINQFNNSATSQNHSANNISGISIHNVSEIQQAMMSIKGIANGSSTSNITIESSIIGNDTQEVSWVDLNYANDSVWTSFAYQATTNPSPQLFSELFENYSWNGEWSSSPKITYVMKTKDVGSLVVKMYNYTSSSWKIVHNWGYDTTYTTEINVSKDFISSGNPLRIWIDFGSGWYETLYFYEGKVLYENVTQGTQYPYNVSFTLGNSNSLDFWMPYSTLNDVYGITNKFKTNSNSKDLIFSRSGTNVTYIDLPCNIFTNSMSFNISGGNGTQTLTKVDNLNTPQHYVLSIENSSANFSLYLPKSSTVQNSPVNLTIIGSPYYSSAGTLSGGNSIYAISSYPGLTYQKANSKDYNGYVNIFGGWSSCGSVFGNGLTLTLSLYGDSGLKGSCTSSPASSSGWTWAIYNCELNLGNDYNPAEEIWVQTTANQAGCMMPKSSSDATIYGYFTGLSQYNRNNATNVSIWYRNMTKEYNYTLELNSSVSLNFNLSTSNMNTYLSTCSEDPCPIPYTIMTARRGNVTISNANIAYLNSISNVTFDIGNDGVIDGSITGSSIPNNNITLNSTGLTAINTYMSGSCVTKSLPIIATSETVGTMSLSNLYLNYSINPISLNASAMNLSGNGNIQVPIKYTADNWGILNTYGLSVIALMDYNYTFTGGSTVSTFNDTQIAKLIWSNFSVKLPETWLDYVDFVPSTNSSKNVTPIGQSDTKPIFNFSYLAREQPMNITVALNETLDSCLNLTVSTNSNKTSGRMLNTTVLYNLINNFNSSSGTKGLWLWGDSENCNASASRWLDPVYLFTSKCSNCI